MHENVIVKEQLNAPVEEVWQALTDNSQLRKWYFEILDFKLEVGEKFNFFEPGGENKYHHRAEILELIPNEKFKHTWTYPELAKEETTVNWQLEKDGNQTVVTLTHEGLENLSHLGKDFQKESFENGWTEILGKNLKEFLESRR